MKEQRLIKILIFFITLILIITGIKAFFTSSYSINLYADLPFYYPDYKPEKIKIAFENSPNALDNLNPNALVFSITINESDNGFLFAKIRDSIYFFHLILIVFMTLFLRFNKLNYIELKSLNRILDIYFGLIFFFFAFDAGNYQAFAKNTLIWQSIDGYYSFENLAKLFFYIFVFLIIQYYVKKEIQIQEIINRYESSKNKEGN